MKYINVGVLANTHGLRGEVKVKCLSDFPHLRFAKGNTLFLSYQNEYLPLIVQTVKETKGMLIVKFKGYDDINDVEAWKGSMLVVGEDALQALDEDEAYYHELMDVNVQDTEHNLIGNVVEIIETGANVVLRVRGEKEVLIPYVKAFVLEFDKTEKIMTVKLLEGML